MRRLLLPKVRCLAHTHTARSQDSTWVLLTGKPGLWATVLCHLPQQTDYSTQCCCTLSQSITAAVTKIPQARWL